MAQSGGARVRSPFAVLELDRFSFTRQKNTNDGTSAAARSIAAADAQPLTTTQQ
jgi:hypothetical protein